MSYSLPHLHTNGTHYETGLAIGIEFKNRIQKFIQEFSEFHTQIIPFINEHKGKIILENYLKLVQEKYPWYVDEMRGISMGSQVDFDLILALNFRVELIHITNESNLIDNSSKECSDFFLIDRDNHLLIHNEDSVASVYNTCYIVTCKIKSSIYNGIESPEEEFTCYCYPGHLAGNAFGFNSSGFCFGVNALYPKKILLDRIPRQIINRVMMSAKSLKELETIFLKVPISYGVCLNVGYFGKNVEQINTDWTSEFNSHQSKEFFGNEIMGKKLAWNYELAPNALNRMENKVSKHFIIEPYLELKTVNDSNLFTQRYYYHFNHYSRFSIEECYNASSQDRQKRAEEISVPLNKADLINIASDTTNLKHPIFRTLRDDDPSELKTIATALFDLNEKTMAVFTKQPNVSEPFLTIRMV